jgi:hypothetical protein
MPRSKEVSFTLKFLKKNCMDELYLSCAPGVTLPHSTSRKEVKVNGSRNRPGVAQRFPGGLVSQISMTFDK